MHAATLSGGDRTNNHSEGWNNHLQHLVGHKKPSVWRLLEALQADTAEASAKLLRHAVGTLSPKKKRRNLLQRHRSDCCDCALNMSVAVVT